MAGAGLLVLASSLGSMPFVRAASISVAVLLDLGDGVYFWSQVSIADPSATNASWNATLTAAARHGLRMDSAWYACCGLAVTDIGERHPPSGFPGLFLWNRTARSWELAPTGISGLLLHDGDAIAWYNAAFDSADFTRPPRLPVPTPDHPEPSPMFRGNARNTGASASDAPATARVLWDRDLGVTEIGSTPAVAYGRVFVTTRGGLVAIDEEAGGVLWTNPRVAGFSSPAVVDGTLIVGSSDGRVYGVDAADGAERWNVSLIHGTGFSGITSSPKVAFDWAYVGTFNESGGPGEVVALWVSNGTVAWRHPTGSVHFSSPAVVGGTVYVGVAGRYNTTSQVTFDPPYGVLALRATDGSERWFYPTSGPVAASPVPVGSDLVVVPSKDGTLQALEAADGRPVWRAHVDADVSSPALRDGTLVVGGGAFGGTGRVTAVNASTGVTSWTFAPNGPVQSSITVADGRVYFATNAANGTIYALSADTGAPVWTYRPEPAQFILGSPVVADGTLFAPSDSGHVYAFRDAPAATGPNLVIIGIVIAVVFAVAVAPIAVVYGMLRRRLKGRG